MAAAPHLKVDVAAAVAGEAGPLQSHHLLLVGVADGEARQTWVPVLVDVADGGARRGLDLQLSEGTQKKKKGLKAGSSWLTSHYHLGLSQSMVVRLVHLTHMSCPFYSVAAIL